MPKNTKKFFLATQMKHDQSSYFCRGPDDFCWALPPWAPPWWRGCTTPDRMGKGKGKRNIAASNYYSLIASNSGGGSVAECLACWTQAQKGLGSNASDL